MRNLATVVQAGTAAGMGSVSAREFGRFLDDLSPLPPKRASHKGLDAAKDKMHIEDVV